MPPLSSSLFTFCRSFLPRKSITSLCFRHKRLNSNSFSSSVQMKKSGFFAASFAAASASATALSASSPAPAFLWDCGNTPQYSHQEEGNAENSSAKASLTERFAPRFDGLRFIETLVTAHR